MKLIGLKEISNYWNKSIIFFKEDKANYWHKITPCNIKVIPPKPERYYLDFSSKAEYPMQFDNAGIPLYQYLNEIPVGYHPIVICQYALGLYDLLFESKFKNKNYEDKFLIQADWLISNVSIKNNISAWYFNFPDKRYNINAPWCSAMAQGEAMSVLSRAYVITKEKKYLLTAESALNLFKISVEDGGVLDHFKGLPLFEEFPGKKITGVLNGFIFALFGIHDLVLISEDTKAKKIFNEGIKSLEKLLMWYDLGYWTRYDLFDFPLMNPASFTYHNLHVEQLKALYILTGIEQFRSYSERWQKYTGKFFNKVKALSQKIIYLKRIHAI